MQIQTCMRESAWTRMLQKRSSASTFCPYDRFGPLNEHFFDQVLESGAVRKRIVYCNGNAKNILHHHEKILKVSIVIISFQSIVAIKACLVWNDVSRQYNKGCKWNPVPFRLRFRPFLWSVWGFCSSSLAPASSPSLDTSPSFSSFKRESPSPVKVAITKIQNYFPESTYYLRVVFLWCRQKHCSLSSGWLIECNAVPIWTRTVPCI